MSKAEKSKSLPFGPIILISLLAFAFITPAIASYEPIFHPSLKISRISGAINIDGKLDDPAWKSAAMVDNFIERSPGDNSKPEVDTRVFVTYDDTRLYVAYACYDDPSAVRATMCQRDQFGADDAVCLLIDTYSNASWAYEFFVNSYGIQKDRLWSSIGGEDPGYDLIWESAANKTDSGYAVEIAIPFASLRFPDEDIQNWKIDFWRNRPRETLRQYSWAAYDRNEQCWPCQWGTVEGIEKVYPGQGLEILPAFVGHQSGALTDIANPDSRFDNGNLRGELSVGGKYSISSDVTVESAFNPDFSQIEADADQIDVNSTIALMYPERRPFFQEGSDIFRTMFNSFYTRMINDPRFTAKMTGRMGRSSIGFLSAMDQNSPYLIPLDQSSITVNAGKSFVNILRGSRAMGENSNIGFMVTDRRFEKSGSGTIVSLDGRMQLSKNYGVDGQFIGTYTKEPTDTTVTAPYNAIKFGNSKYDVAFNGESFYGSGFISRFFRRSRNWGFMVDYNQVNPSYRTETGYDPVINYRNLTFSTSYTFYPNNSICERITPGAYNYRRWGFDGKKRTEVMGIQTDGQIKFAQTYFRVEFNRGQEVFRDILFDKIWDMALNLDGQINNQIGIGGSITRGQHIAYFAMAKGIQTNINAYMSLKPIDRITIEPSLLLSKMTASVGSAEYFDGFIARTRVQYQATKEMSFRLVTQYNDFYKTWDIDPLLTYRLSPFSLFYVGSAYDYGELARTPNDPSQWKMTSRQFFMKLQYLFQT